MLQSRRQAVGLTRWDLARALRTDQSQISKLERSERRLDIVDYLRICRAIGVDRESRCVRSILENPRGSKRRGKAVHCDVIAARENPATEAPQRRLLIRWLTLLSSAPSLCSSNFKPFKNRKVHERPIKVARCVALSAAEHRGMLGM
jgi:transcriptional regulator with XRE-family HTH domain